MKASYTNLSYRLFKRPSKIIFALVCKSQWIVAAVIALLASLAPSSQATLLLYEGFNYGGTAGTLVGKGTASGGWGGAWQSGTHNYTGSPFYNESYQPAGLTFSTLPTIGGYATAVATGDGYINLGRVHTAATTGTLFGSYLYRTYAGAVGVGLGAVMESTPNLANPNNYAQFSIEADRYGTLAGGDLGGTLMDLDYGTSAGTPISANETYLVLFKVTNLGVSPAIHSATMWILREGQYDNFIQGGLTETELNAASLGTGPTQVLQRAVDTTGNMVAQFASGNMLMMQSYYSSPSEFDELRISDTSLDEAVSPSSTTGPVKLTTNVLSDTVPKWHPSNGKIAYHRLNGVGGLELASVNSNGTGETLMVSGLEQPPYGYTTLISWLGSTNTLLCVETNTFHELLAFNTALAPFARTVADGNDAAFTRKLFVPGGRYSNCFVASRDGNTVAWRDQPNAGGANTLTIRSSPYIPLSGQDTNAFGTVVLTATDPSIGTRGMALSPNGTKLVISIPNGPGFDLWLYTTTGIGTPEQLTTDGITGNLNLNADISPDGTKILYQHGTAAPGSSDLWLMNIDGSGKTNITQTTGVDESAPSWGPDGTQYAFARIDGTESNIYRDTLPAASSTVKINFDNLAIGPQAANFLAAYGIPSVTFSGAPQSQGPFVTSALGNSVASSPPNILYQAAGANEQYQAHILTFNFTPQLSAFSLDRVGKTGGGSTDTWHADFYNAAGVQIGTMGESVPVVDASVQTFSFTAPAGQTIARMDLVSVWTGFATNATIPVDDFILTASQTQASNNANLASLTLSAGSLSPTFASGTVSYTASVANETTSLTVTPTVAASGTVTVNGLNVTSGSASGSINLNVGNNTITTLVTAANGITTKMYTVVVNRASNENLSNLALNVGSLSPAFASGTTSYSASVSNTTTSLTVTPTVADGTATVTVNSLSVISGTPSTSINLNVGNNTITIVVTPQSGATKTYTVVVSRAPSTNANLSNLVLSGMSISPAFDSGTTSYTASVPNATTALTVTPTVQDSTATVKVNNVTVSSGSASGSINLIVGNNTITTVAKAQDGTTTKTYTVVVTRAPSSNANLANLTQNTGSFTPVFASGTLSYASTVAYPVATIRITPTLQDSTATVKVNNVTVASGSASGNINLAVGLNTITTVVKAQDTSTTKTYTLQITRTAPSTNANLANLSLSATAISPAFATATTSYTGSVAHLTLSTTATPTIQDSTATVKINGVSTSSGVASGNLGLTVGTNTISTVVTAEDGITKKTYSVEVTRAPLVAIWNTATDIPLTISSYTAEGAVEMTLNFAPEAGTTLTVVKNTSLAFIVGRFTNLAQGQTVTLTYNGIDYDFVANYYGGSGNDLVLMWANVRPMSWGAGGAGALGKGNNLNGLVPDDVDQSGVLLEKSLIAMAAGGSHSLAVCADGTLAAWGDNAFGQLGDNTIIQRTVPVAVNAAGALSNKTVIAVSAGTQHSLALCSDGTVAAWGDNAFGQLGDNSTTQRKVPVAVYTAGALSGKTVIAISAGQYHSLALCSNGTVVAWGANFNGQLGDNTTIQRKLPVAVLGVLSSKTTIAISACQFHNVAVCSDGTMAAWGANVNGQLGDNTTGAQRPAPVAVDATSGSALFGKTVIAAAAGGFGHSFALCSDGTLAAWGSNFSGQLGNNSTAQSNRPTAVNQSGLLAGKTIVALLSGSDHGLVRCIDSTLFSWGGNGSGQLGNNGFANSLVAVAVNTSNLEPGDRFSQVSSSGAALHSLALVASPAPTGPIPIVTTLAATAVTSSSATLHATVNANGSSTDVSFNHGLTALYGSTISGTPASVTGSSANAVSANLTGLAPGSTYHFRVRGVNGNGTKKGSDLSFSTPSNNADLNGLALSSGSLNPGFAGGTISYSVTVPNATTSITVTPTVAENHATVTVDGTPVNSGSPSAAISLNVGENLPIVTVVTAQDGTTLKTYSLVVTRLPISNNANLAGLSLSKGTLSPVFAGGTISYTADVSNAIASLTATPTAADSGATVKVNNVTVDSGDASGAIILGPTGGTITIEVTAENGSTTKTYTVEVVRGVPSNNANLANLVPGSGTLDPSFSSAGTDYSVTVAYETSSITVTPTVADGTATLVVNNVSVLSGAASGGISLVVGDNTITTVVSAENGSTTKDYVIHVTRLPREFRWGGTTGSWSEAAKWVQLAAPDIGGEPPVGLGTAPMILHFANNPVPVNASTPTTYTATNDQFKVTFPNYGFFAVSKLILDGGVTGASGTGTNIIGSPTPGVGDPNLFLKNGGSIVNSTSHGVAYVIQNYITANLNLTLSGNGTSVVKLLQPLQPNLFVLPWSFPALLQITKEGTSTFELPGAQSSNTTYELREGVLQTAPGNLNSGAITLGHVDSASAILKIGTNSISGGGLADTADITVVAGPLGSTRTIQSLSTALNESVNLAGNLTIPTGAAVRMDTGASEESIMSMGSNGSTLSGGGDLIVCGSGRLFFSPLLDNSTFTGRIIVESGSYQAPPAIPGGGGFTPPPTTLGGGEMAFGESNGNYTQDIVVVPPGIGAPLPVINVTDNGVLAGLFTMNGGADMTVADGKNFVFDGGLSGTIPVNQSLNVNATGTGSVALSGNNSGFSGTIDFGRDVGSAGAAASLVIGDAAAFPATVDVNVFAGKLIFAAPGNSFAAGSIDFMAAAPGATAPELVLQNDTPGTPKSVTLQGAISYARDTIIQINEAADILGITGNLINTIPDAGIDKTGPGTLVLSALANGLPADNYKAPTNVIQGKLKVNRNISDSDVSVANGATLGGSGTVGDLTVAPGAIIAPGNSPGTLTTGAATLAGSTLAMEIDGSLADKLVSTGALNINGAALTVTVLGGGFTPGAAYVIAQGSSLTGTFSSVPINYVVTYTSTQAILTQTLTAWINGFNPSLSTADKLPGADPDKDGISNLLELTLGGNPVVSSQTILPTQSIEGNNFVIRFKRSDSSEFGSTLSLEISDNLVDWNIIPHILIGQATSSTVSIGENGAAPDDVSVSIPLGPLNAKFVRLKVVAATP